MHGARFCMALLLQKHWPREATLQLFRGPRQICGCPLPSMRAINEMRRQDEDEESETGHAWTLQTTPTATLAPGLGTQGSREVAEAQLSLPTTRFPTPASHVSALFPETPVSRTERLNLGA